MAAMNQVYKKIVWKLNETKEELKAYQLGVSIESPATKIMIGVNTTTWFLRIYPRGQEIYKDHASLYLCLKTADSKKFKGRFSLGVIGTKGNKELTFEHPAKSFNVGYGCSDLLKQDELFNLDREYFTAGKLTIYCQLTLSDDVTASDDAQTLSKQSVVIDLKRMLDEEMFADFKVETSDKKVLKAHKNILAVRSPYFYGMLKSGLKETKLNIVKVPEDAVHMKAVLSFIYTGEVANLQAIADQLVLVAQKYLLDHLKKICIESITKSLSCDNAVAMLLAAEGLTDAEELRKKCIDVIASNFEFLSTTAEWGNLSPDMFTEIIRHANSEVSDTINV